MHTAESSPCGQVRAKKITRMYQEAGYAGIVVTDHFSDGAFRRFTGRRGGEMIDHFLNGYRRAKEEGDRIGITVLFGIELTLAGTTDDFLLYGPDEEFLYQAPDLRYLGLPEIRRLADAEGFVLFQAHPFRAVCRVASASLLDGIEIYNGNPRQESNNRTAEEYARKHDLLEIAGSDAHLPGDVAVAGIVAERLPRSSGELADLLKDRSKYTPAFTSNREGLMLGAGRS